MDDKFIVHEAHLAHFCNILDTIMIAIHLLQPDDDGNLLVTPEAIASMLSLAHSAIDETIDNIREYGAKEAQS